MVTLALFPKAPLGELGLGLLWLLVTFMFAVKQPQTARGKKPSFAINVVVNIEG